MGEWAVPAAGMGFGTALTVIVVWVLSGSIRKTDADTLWEKLLKDNDRLRADNDVLRKEQRAARRSERRRWRLVYPVLEECAALNPAMRDAVNQVRGSLDQEEIEDIE